MQHLGATHFAVCLEYEGCFPSLVTPFKSQGTVFLKWENEAVEDPKENSESSLNLLLTLQYHSKIKDCYHRMHRHRTGTFMCRWATSLHAGKQINHQNHACNVNPTSSTTNLCNADDGSRPSSNPSLCFEPEDSFISSSTALSLLCFSSSFQAS